MALAARLRGVSGFGNDGVKVIARRIGIVGGGPAGLAAAKVLSQENKRCTLRGEPCPFNSITILERNNDIGGIWLYTPDPVCHYNIPQPDADDAILTGYDERSKITNGFPTPIYDNLNTNLPKDVMCYNNLPFSDSVPEFPTSEQVLRYVESYVKEYDLRQFLHLNSEVVSAAYDDCSKEWVCKVKRLDKDVNTEDELRFDALLVCVGRVTHPYIPDVPGLSDLARMYPKQVIHAKEYRRPSDFKSNTILIVGGASSGADISRLLSFTEKTIHQSVTNAQPPPDGLDPTLGEGQNKKNPLTLHPRIQSINIDKSIGCSDSNTAKGEIVFVDGSKMPIPDVIIYATGYLAAYPFLKNSDGSSLNISDGRSFRDLYKQLLYINNPTLALFGVPYKVVPFPLYEYQSLYLSCVFQGMPLPSIKDMHAQWQRFISDKDNKQVHELGLGQVEYSNDLVDFANSFIGSSEVKEYHKLSYVTNRWFERRKNTFLLRKKILGY